VFYAVIRVSGWVPGLWMKLESVVLVETTNGLYMIDN
jgi:hypothetical protein